MSDGTDGTHLFSFSRWFSTSQHQSNSLNSQIGVTTKAATRAVNATLDADPPSSPAVAGDGDTTTSLTGR